MKKTIAIIFLFNYLLATTELSQILKLPFLIEHFFKYKEIIPNGTLMDFLNIHYKNHQINQSNNDDSDEDKRLPFIVSGNLFNPIFILSNCINSVKFKNFIIPLSDIKKIQAISFFISSFQTSIWKPPKFIGSISKKISINLFN